MKKVREFRTWYNCGYHTSDDGYLVKIVLDVHRRFSHKKELKKILHCLGYSSWCCVQKRAVSGTNCYYTSIYPDRNHPNTQVSIESEKIGERVFILISPYGILSTPVVSELVHSLQLAYKEDKD